VVNETHHMSTAGDFSNRNEDITTGTVKNVAQIAHYITNKCILRKAVMNVLGLYVGLIFFLIIF
jgi:hypothetical protein